MKAAQVDRVIHGTAAGFPTEDPEQLVGPGDVARADFPLPASDVRELLGGTQKLLAPPQALLGLVAAGDVSAVQLKLPRDRRAAQLVPAGRVSESQLGFGGTAGGHGFAQRFAERGGVEPGQDLPQHATGDTLGGVTEQLRRAHGFRIEPDDLPPGAEQRRHVGDRGTGYDLGHPAIPVCVAGKGFPV